MPVATRTTTTTATTTMVGVAILLLMMWASAWVAPPAFASPADEEAKNCAAFATQPEAQAWFTAHGGSTATNAGGLDADRDGIACEHLPAAGSTGEAEDEGVPWLWIGLGIAGVGAAGVGGAAVVALTRASATGTTSAFPSPVTRPFAMTPPALPDDIPCDPPPPGWPEVTPERARELAAMPEAAYRATPEWMQRTDAVLAVTGNRCQLCGTDSSADLMLPDQVRHRAGERRGDERPCDLIVLCDRCAAQVTCQVP